MAGPSWEEIQEIKSDALKLAAQHAIEQQKQDQADPVPLPLTNISKTSGELIIEQRPSGAIQIDASAAPYSQSEPAKESFRINFEKPIDMLAQHSGLAMTIQTHEGTSAEVRWGVRLIGSNGKIAEITPVIPLLNHWGLDQHEIYFDWAFINYARVEDAIDVLNSVKALEFTVASIARSPKIGPSDTPKMASFRLSHLQLVDYIFGSFDPNRHSWGWDGRDQKDLTLQHRVLEVSGVVAQFAGEQGLVSAVHALDMAARTQCRDGSFLDRRRGPRTVVSGEYTHGFTLWGLIDAYTYFEKVKLPALDEIITAGPKQMTRREWYQDMIYHAAMSRATAVASEYRDDIIHSNTLIFGANRVLGYAVAMRRAADVMIDPSRREEILKHYQPIIKEIAAAQGAHSGGFPILGEGDKFKGKGIHYDAGYTRTHMDWLVIGIEATGDPLLLKMLERYQIAIQAIMDQKGEGILALLSERGKGTDSVRLVIPDATAQVGLRYGLPAIAQWGYNTGIPRWAQWEPGARINHFTNRMHARGYSLGAHTNILLSDLNQEPKPHDIGYRFPRQFPIWSSRFYAKESGKQTRTSHVQIHADGTMTNDFNIEIGEFLETIGVPVWLECSKGQISVEAVALNGWPTLLEDKAELHLDIGENHQHSAVNQPIEFTLKETTPVQLTISGPSVTLPEVAGGMPVPFQTKIILTPSEPDTLIKLTLRNDTPDYIHVKP